MMETHTALPGISVIGLWLALMLPPTLSAEVAETLDLTTYLEETLRYHQIQQQHDARAPAEALSLTEGERYYWPQVTARSDFSEATDETQAGLPALSSKEVQSGITTELDTTWTSWVGTDVTLGLEHQYGRQLGKVAQGIPEDDLQAHTLSVEVSQPLLRHNRLFYNRLPLYQAQTEWDLYQNEGELNRLTLLRDAMLDYLSVQDAHDRLDIQKDKLEHARYLADISNTLVAEGRSLDIDLDLARLDVLRQEQAVANAQLGLEQSQRRLSLPWVPDVDIRVQPLPSFSALIDRLLPLLNIPADADRHPEYRKRRLQLHTATLEQRAGQRDRWPDLQLYYRYEKNYREVLPDEENQSWGLRVSYALFDLPTREQQARRQADTTIARWNLEDSQKQLSWEATERRQTADTLLSELDLHARSLALSQRALDQDLARYQEGLTSYSTIQDRQNDLSDRKLETLTTETELARTLVELAYYRQWDWLNRLP